MLIKMSVQTVSKGRFASQGKETSCCLVTGKKEERLYVVDAVGGQQVGKRLTPFSSLAAISISMWIYTLAEYVRCRAPRLVGIYGRARADLVY